MTGVAQQHIICSPAEGQIVALQQTIAAQRSNLPSNFLRLLHFYDCLELAEGLGLELNPALRCTQHMVLNIQDLQDALFKA